MGRCLKALELYMRCVSQSGDAEGQHGPAHSVLSQQEERWRGEYDGPVQDTYREEGEEVVSGNEPPDSENERGRERGEDARGVCFWTCT